jgi:hypothetical protein
VAPHIDRFVVPHEKSTGNVVAALVIDPIAGKNKLIILLPVWDIFYVSIAMRLIINQSNAVLFYIFIWQPLLVIS